MNPGDELDKYRFIRKLGEGGLAEVWLASHLILPRQVAIKFLKPVFAGISDSSGRFDAEAILQAGLDHPNIVQAIDVFTHGGRQFLVMQYIEGETLGDLLARLAGPFPLQQLVEIAQRVLAAVDYAHQRGVVHRDLKPSNILLDKSGKAWLTDFGVALAFSVRRVTQAGISVGTPEYMSPEQVNRTFLVGGRSDLYSFGVVLYEMLTGRLPFDAGDGDRDFLIKQKHLLEQPVAPRQWNSAIPEQVEAVVLRALRKEPEDRFQRASEMAEALESAATVKPSRKGPEPVVPPVPEPPVPEPPVPEPPAPEPAIALRDRSSGRVPAALLLLALLAGGWWLWADRTRVQKSAPSAVVQGPSDAEGPGRDTQPQTGSARKKPVEVPPPQLPTRKRVCTEAMAIDLPFRCPPNDQFCRTCKIQEGIPDGVGLGKDSQ